MDPHHHLMHVSMDPGGGGSSGDRYPQWSFEETKELLTIRAELDQSFMETKRNKVLWEAISTKMKEKGYHRSADQCKCKWKNLVTRYKGCETMEGEGTRQQQFPFYNEVNEIMGARMERIMWADMGAGKRKKEVLWSDEDEESEGEKGGGAKRRKKGKGNVGGGSNSNNVVIREMLEGLVKQQMEMEAEWRQAYEERERERRKQEMEWRERMEAVERERLLMERRWREREDQRRIREEARAQKRDALITALLDKMFT